MSGAPTDLVVEVVHAHAEGVVVGRYRLPQSATVEDALREAAADPAFLNVLVADAAVGVFGRIAAAQQILTDGDRVEIYRPLAADPKNARRARARAAHRRR